MLAPDTQMAETEGPSPRACLPVTALVAFLNCTREGFAVSDLLYYTLLLEFNLPFGKDILNTNNNNIIIIIIKIIIKILTHLEVNIDVFSLLWKNVKN